MSSWSDRTTMELLRAKLRQQISGAAISDVVGWANVLLCGRQGLVHGG
jgi:hypothetical protein